MKYLCMIFYDEKKHTAMSESEHVALTDEALDYDDVMRKGGHYVTSGEGRQAYRYRWPVRRNERADRRIHRNRGQRPQ
jgi:hypothetical protein